MILDDNNSRRLGVGERITEGVYARFTETDQEWTRLSSEDGCVGDYVSPDDMIEYRVPVLMQTFSTGSIRQNKTGKGRYDLIPLEGIRALALHYEQGAIAHGDRNWERGQPLSVFKNSLTRHACQVGYDFTEDHAAAVAWNAFGYITTCERIRAGLLPAELDDLGVTNKEIVR